MNMTSIEDNIEKLEFVKRAKECFEKTPEFYSYTDNHIVPGCLFAMKMGFLDDCILVFKLDESFTPELFQQAIDRTKVQEAKDKKEKPLF